MCRSICRVIISSVLILGMVLTTVPARGKPADQDVGALVQTLYESGQNRYEKEQYVSAATLWNEALELLLQQDPEHSTTKMILLGIVDAYRQSSIRSTNPKEELEAAMQSITAYRKALGRRSPSAEVVEAESELQGEIDQLNHQAGQDNDEQGDEIGSDATPVSMGNSCVGDSQCSGQSICVNGRCTGSLRTIGLPLDFSSQLTNSGKWVLITGGGVIGAGLFMTILGVVRGNDLYRRYDREFEQAKLGTKTFADVDNTYRIYQRFQGLYLSGFGVIGGGVVAIISGAVLLTFGKKLQQRHGYSTAKMNRWRLIPRVNIKDRNLGFTFQGKF